MSGGINGVAAGEAYARLQQEAGKRWREARTDDSSWVTVGCATCGVAAGAGPVRAAFVESLAELGLSVPVTEVGCMGHCYAEPMATVKRPGYPALVYNRLTPVTVKNLVHKFFTEEDPYFDVFLGAVEENEMGLPRLADLPRYSLEERRLLRRCGEIDPDDVYQAIAHGAYQGLAHALACDDPLAVVKQAGLRGLGGAGFPVWKKWAAVIAQGAAESYLVANADEGDPGAFMDRAILESDPHAMIEGMLIAARVMGCRAGFVYVRAEYPLAVARLGLAVSQARELGLLGEDVLGSGLDFDVEIVAGAGAFVCGEETALIASIEGKRGMPRTRPPFPAERGLFGMPTAVNNVKTLANVALIFAEGPERFASIGSGASRGTAVFALAGKIANPGLVEIPMGATLREVIFDVGGGVPAGRAFKAVQIGGPSGGCLPESLLDTPVDFDSLRAAGAIMGSGGMVVLDEDNCMVDAARYFLAFTQNESCGKCTFCRIGTKHMLDVLDRIVAGAGQMSDLDLLEELAHEVRLGSLCNLGKTAPNPVLTTLKYFRHEYEAHIQEGRCEAKVCQELTAYYIDPIKCARGCDACVGSCPPEAIYEDSKRVKVVEQEQCVKCDSCMGACPPEYDAVVKISPVRETPAVEARPRIEE